MSPDGLGPQLHAASSSGGGGADHSLEPAYLPLDLEGGTGSCDGKYDCCEAFGGDSIDRRVASNPAVNGVTSEGFATIVFPIARAGATFQVKR